MLFQRAIACFRDKSDAPTPFQGFRVCPCLSVIDLNRSFVTAKQNLKFSNLSDQVQKKIGHLWPISDVYTKFYKIQYANVPLTSPVQNPFRTIKARSSQQNFMHILVTHIIYIMPMKPSIRVSFHKKKKSQERWIPRSN